MHRDSKVQAEFKKEKQQLTELYQQLKNISGAVDTTLQQHTEALAYTSFKEDRST